MKVLIQHSSFVENVDIVIDYLANDESNPSNQLRIENVVFKENRIERNVDGTLLKRRLVWCQTTYSEIFKNTLSPWEERGHIT